MEKVKDGYRVSVRLNKKNHEHQEIYRMFQELIKSGRFANESEILRAGIKSLYQDVNKPQSDDSTVVSDVSIERIVSRVCDAIEDLLSEKVLVENKAESAVAMSDNRFLNHGASAPEETTELPDGLCDFMNLM